MMFPLNAAFSTKYTEYGIFGKFGFSDQGCSRGVGGGPSGEERPQRESGIKRLRKAS